DTATLAATFACRAMRAFRAALSRRSITPDPRPHAMPMSLSRQGGHYLGIGVVQWLLDWAVMVALSHHGMSVELANIIGRISGALLGFWLNGRITFAGDDTAVGRRQLLRFLVMWLLTTAASTWSMGAINHYAGLKWAWLA